MYKNVTIQEWLDALRSGEYHSKISQITLRNVRGLKAVLTRKSL